MNKKYLIALAVVILIGVGSVAYFKYCAKRQNVSIEKSEMEGMLKDRAEEEIRKKIYVPFIEVYKNMLAQSPDNVDIKKKLAMAYFSAGQKEEAKVILKELQDKNQLDAESLELLNRTR